MQETDRASGERVMVIIGGSIAGALAAGVAARHFDRVLVVERDSLPEAPGPRRGVPHAQHFHALLMRGRKIIEETYPGFTAETRARGAVLASHTLDCMVMRRYGWAPRFESPLQALLVSRELIEWVIRERASRQPGIEFLQGAEVTGITTAGGRVTGVRVRREGGEDELRADVVVDASGRQSRLPDWLAEAGYARPEEVTVNAHWAYTSCFVEVPDGFDPGFQALSALPRGAAAGQHPARTRGASMWVQDGDHRWILTAMGSAGDHPPADEDGLRAFIASLDYQPLDRAVEKVRFTGPPRVWRNTVNRLRRYDQIDMPGGLLVIGDAFAAFNPVYGQGMTVAAMAADNLRAELEADDADGARDLASRVQARLAADALFCWGMATGADYRVDGVVGPPPPDGIKERTAFMDRVEALASEDPEVYVRFQETVQLMRSTEWLRDPVFEARVRDDWDRLGKLVGAEP